MQLEKHYTNRSGWLRAAVLGANDGILSTTSIAIGVAAASTTNGPVILAALAGLVGGALSMAAGEYVSVSSQSDVEHSDLERERMELETMPETELHELAKIYQDRGVEEKLSLEVARQLTAHDALGAHARDELGINEITTAKPMQAAFSSAASFTVGGMLPLAIAFFVPLHYMIVSQYASALLFLAFSGALAAKAGGSSLKKAIIRICIWGSFAMLMSALIGRLFGVQVA